MDLTQEKGFNCVYEKDDMGYKNPLNPELDTADPCIRYNHADGYYYGIYTGHDKLTLHRSRELRDMFIRSESRVIYSPKDEDGTYGFLWAPELHVIDGVWYIYTSTHEKETKARKHLICLRAKSDELFDGFELCGHIDPDFYAIDPTVYKDDESGRLYICASAVLDGQQKLVINELKTPSATAGEWRIIASPLYDWEKVYPYDGTWAPINEGAYFVKKDSRLFIIYSGNGCWSDDYVMGIIEFVGDDLLNPEHWVKSPEPFMTKGNGCVGPGHATFFNSPDGSELWICHHCLKESDPDFKPMNRHCHVQKVFFDKTGFPHADHPLVKGIGYKEPKK